MKHYILLLLLLLCVCAAAEEPEKPPKAPSETDPIPTIDLDTIAAGKLKAGLEIGYPFTGITAGYHFSETLEGNIIVGSVLDFDRLALGANLMLTLANLKTGEYLFPLSVGPAIYAEIQSEDTEFYGGGLMRLEYNFEKPFNLYLQTGILISLSIDDPEFYWPVSLGIRYVF